MRIVVIFLAAFWLAACSETPQVNGNGVRQDASAYQGTGMPYVAGGWKPGDRNSWEQALKVRAQNGQNDYTKAN